MNKKKYTNQRNEIVSGKLILSLILLPLLSVSLAVSHNFIDSLVSPKEFYLFFYLAAFIIIFFIYRFFHKNKTKQSFNITDLFLSLYYLYCILRIAFSQSDQFYGSYFFQLSGMIILYFLVKFLITSDENGLIKSVFFGGILLFGFIQVTFGYLQLWDFASPATLDFKIGGSFGNPGPFSNYVVSILPLALGLYLFWPGNNRFNLFLSETGKWITVLILLLLPATKARTSWIAAIACISYLLWNYDPAKAFIKKITRHFFTKLGLLFVIIIFASFSAYYLFNYKQDSANGRLFTWKIAWEIIEDHPVFGSGFNSFQVMHNDYQAAFFENKNTNIPEAKLADNITFAFNDFLQIGSELGIIGFGLFLTIILSIFINPSEQNNKINNVAGLLARSSVLGIAICSLFSYPFHDIPLMTNFFVLLAIASSTKKNVFSIPIRPAIFRSFTFIIVIGSIMFLNMQYKRYIAHKEWKTASVQIRKNGARTIKKYEKLYPILKYNGYFLYNYGAELSLINEPERAIDILSKALPKLNDADVYTYLGNSYENIGNLQMAEKSFLHAWHLVPHKLYPPYRLVYIYANSDRLEEALKLAAQIVKADVKIQSKVTDDIKAEMTSFINNNLNQNTNKIE